MRGEIFALSHLGNAAARRGEVSAALRPGGCRASSGPANWRDPWYLAMALNNYGYSRMMSGNVDQVTEELLTESLQLRRSLDEKRGVGFTLGSLAELQLLRGDLDAAAATVEEMLILSDRSHSRRTDLHHLQPAWLPPPGPRQPRPGRASGSGSPCGAPAPWDSSS